MATSLVRQIQDHHQDDQVVLLTSSLWGGLFQYWPGLELAVFPRRGSWITLRTVAWIRARRFTRIYDLQSSDRSGMYCALSGVSERVGNHPRYPYTHHPATPYLGRGHIYDRMLEVLASAGLPAEPQPPYLPIGSPGPERVQSWLAGHGLDHNPPVLLHAGASPRHAQKRWPGFADLARHLLDSGLPVIWLGAADEDRQLNRELARVGGINATGEFSLPELAELARHARFAVVNDSGPMHALAAAGIPVYALFGPTDWRRTHAFGQRERVISPQHEEGPFTPAPLSGIQVSEVLQRLAADGLIPQSN